MFDTLFLREFADEQGVILLCHNIAVQPLNDHFLLLSGVNDAVVTLEDIDVVADADVAIVVFLTLLVQ